MTKPHWMLKHIFYLIPSVLFLNLSAQTADFAFTNAKIYTSHDALPFASAMAVEGELIVYVGDEQGLNSYIADDTQVFNMEGKLMMPGIHDVHQHALEASSTAGGNCTLDHSSMINGLISELTACNPMPNSNGWIVAAGHSIFSLLDLDFPAKYYLDDIYLNEPVCILEETSHSVWVNSKALEILGIDENTPDPPGGHIFKHWSNGEVHGILMDNAGDAVLQVALASNPDIDQNHYDGLVEYGLPLLARQGITSICEGRTYFKQSYPEIWQEVYNNDQLTVRLGLAPWIYPDDSDDQIIQSIKSMYVDDHPMLNSRQIKCYSDGIIINATAAFHEPYDDHLDMPFNQGLNYLDKDRLTDLVTKLEKEGFDFHIHAIGDRGVTEALDAIESARMTNGDLGRRHRITHLEFVKESDIPRFVALNVVADFQVAADWTQPDAWSENAFFVGPERAMNFMPLKFFNDANALITLSSDWDVSTVNPFVGMENALTRAPQNLPDMETIVKAYTINGAYVMQHEDITGSLVAGKMADFICVDQDIFTINPEDISSTKVLSTWLAGKEIFSEHDFTNHTEEAAQVSTDWNVKAPLGQFQIIVSIPSADLNTIELYSLSGDLIIVKKVLNQSKAYIDASKFPSGQYYLKVYDIYGNRHQDQISIIH